MTDYRNVLERDLARVGPAPFDFYDVARRHDRLAVSVVHAIDAIDLYVSSKQ